MGFVDWLRRRDYGKSPPPLPPNVQQSGPKDDATEGASASAKPTEPQTFVIEYIDAGGLTSTRIVTAQAIGLSVHDDVILQCFCHLRGAARHFRVDRIEHVIDLDGVIIEDVGSFLLDNLGDLPTLRFKFKAPIRDTQSERTKRRNQIRSANRDYIRILVAIARADGRYRREEEQPIFDFVAAEYGKPLDVADETWLRNYIHRMNPTLNNVETAMEVVGFYIRWVNADGSPDDKRRVKAFAKAIRTVIMADGTVNETEVEILRDLVEYSEWIESQCMAV